VVRLNSRSRAPGALASLRDDRFCARLGLRDDRVSASASRSPSRLSITLGLSASLRDLSLDTVNIGLECRHTIFSRSLLGGALGIKRGPLFIKRREKLLAALLYGPNRLERLLADSVERLAQIVLDGGDQVGKPRAPLRL
jgi:hypothetical protein